MERQLCGPRTQQSLPWFGFWQMEIDYWAELELEVLNMKERVRILHEESEIL